MSSAASNEGDPKAGRSQHQNRLTMAIVECHGYACTKLLLDSAMHVGPIIAVSKQQPFTPEMFSCDRSQFGDWMPLGGRDQQVLSPERQHIESWRVDWGSQERDVDASIEGALDETRCDAFRQMEFDTARLLSEAREQPQHPC